MPYKKRAIFFIANLYKNLYKFYKNFNNMLSAMVIHDRRLSLPVIITDATSKLFKTLKK